MTIIVTDTYTSEQNGKTYDYAGIWQTRGHNVEWSAKVRLNGELVGELKGTIENTPAGADATFQVRKMIESSIETRIGVT